jgi:hypothetical protein
MRNKGCDDIADYCIISTLMSSFGSSMHSKVVDVGETNKATKEEDNAGQRERALSIVGLVVITQVGEKAQLKTWMRRRKAR